MSQSPGRITAVLGPTNTGKTHYAIERMLGHRTGIIGTTNINSSRRQRQW